MKRKFKFSEYIKLIKVSETANECDNFGKDITLSQAISFI